MGSSLPALSLAIVGAGFPNAKGPSRIFELSICEPGEPVALVLEPKNKADPRAVAVYSCRDIQLGYLSAERCGRIGAIIAQGREIRAIFQGRTEYGGVARVAFDGEDPILPAVQSSVQRHVAEPEQDFWPDPEWPD